MSGTWSDYLPTGWEPIDREHARMAERLTELLAAVNAGDAGRAGIAVSDLLRDSAAHFEHEERLMRENGYGQLARHEEAHRLFLGDVGKLAAELLAQGISDAFRRWATGRVLEWFRFHVSANDVALGGFLRDLAPRGPERGDARPGGAVRAGSPAAT